MYKRQCLGCRRFRQRPGKNCHEQLPVPTLPDVRRRAGQGAGDRLRACLLYTSPEEEVRRAYSSFAQRHSLCAQYFVDQVKLSAATMLDHAVVTELAVQDTTELIASAAILSGLAKLFAEKLLLLKDKTLENGGSIEIIE